MSKTICYKNKDNRLPVMCTIVKKTSIKNDKNKPKWTSFKRQYSADAIMKD